MQPTIVLESTPTVSADRSLDVSRAQVGVVSHNRPQFTEETASLLRQRLTAAAGVVAVILAAAFLGNVARGITTLWWVRGLILAILFGIFILLRLRPTFTLNQLRILELGLFGSVLVQLSLMLLTRVGDFATQNDAASLISVQKQMLTAWCIVIFVYGTILPNTWRRGAAYMIPAACVPYGLIAIQGWWSPHVLELMSQDKAAAPLPIPLVAAVVASFATHVINTARREAFKAKQFGQYRLLEKLGSGGMGEVYKAVHMLLKRPCAIKLIKAANDSDMTAIARFEKEVKTTAKLTHWNTIEIYDYGRTDDGTFYYVMELLPGMSFEDLVEQHGPLPPQRAIFLLRQICGALQEAHGIGLIHRDIKPANIFASQRGGVFDVAKLLDFGLVKEGTDPSGERRAGGSRGSFSGTPLFMSPEQASSYDSVDGRADIYSLGAVAYYLLTGQPPFNRKNMLELLTAHRLAEVVPPSRLVPTIPPELDQLILKCLAKDPQDRYQDADALRSAFDACPLSHPWSPEQAAAWWKSQSTSSDVTPDKRVDHDATVIYEATES